MTVTYNVLFAGVGGQGVISVAGLLARSAVASGLEARLYGSYGMAQRGGMVSAHLRIGERVQNARIEIGRANLLVGLELTEAVRWAHILSSEGVLIAADVLIPPVGKIIKDDGIGMRDLLRSFPSAMLVDVESLCGPAGSRGVNAVLLGAASSLEGFPVQAGSIEERMRQEAGSGSERLLEAFRKGRESWARRGR
jgi:indolepyruvate ferredoxin oxidoreductase beta subunit